MENLRFISLQAVRFLSRCLYLAIAGLVDTLKRQRTDGGTTAAEMVLPRAGANAAAAAAALHLLVLLRATDGAGAGAGGNEGTATVSGAAPGRQVSVVVGGYSATFTEATAWTVHEIEARPQQQAAGLLLGSLGSAARRRRGEPLSAPGRSGQGTGRE